MSSKPLKQIHLAAHFPGVNNTTVWSDPAAGSHIDFDSFIHFARTAERAKFDFLFLAEGLRLREQGNEIYDLDVVGRPDTFTVLAALAAVTDRLGLTGTINSTFNEPYEVARQFATLDHLSEGRAAWNVVTSWDAFTGENFRRGGFLPREDRYSRAQEFLATATELFDSWDGSEIAADAGSGTFLRDARAGAFAHRGRHFDIEGRFNVPRSPQGRPVIFQAGTPRRAVSSPRPAPTRSSDGTEPSTRGGSSTRTSRAARPARPDARPAEDPPRGHLRARRHRRGGPGDRTRGAPPPGQRADRDQVPGARLEPGPVRLRPGRSAARDRPPGRGEHHRPGAGERTAVPGSARHRPAVARAGPGQEPVDPRAGHQCHRRPDLRRFGRHDRRVDRRAGAGRRRRRVHPGPPHHPGRPGRLRGLRRTAAPGAGVFRTEYEGTTLRDHLGLAVPTPASASAPAPAPVS